VFFKNFTLFSRKGFELVDIESYEPAFLSASSNNESSAQASYQRPSQNSSPVPGEEPSGPMVQMPARIAIYDDMLIAPRIIDVEAAPLLQFIESMATVTYEKATQLGGRLPYTAIREITENFIHADFRECTVSILDSGNTIRFSDRGPGIEKKLLVLQPGVTSANNAMRRYIKGVGSGFPIVREYLAVNRGSLQIDDNAVDGTIITLSLHSARPVSLEPVSVARDPNPNVDTRSYQPAHQEMTPFDAVPHTPSQLSSLVSQSDERVVLALRVIADIGAAGPNDLKIPLQISAATAFRLLETLEQAGLIEKTTNRKRILSNTGLAFLQQLGAY
jgi:anti-sigma regulatory factor (Ser/Thr protein kinase)